MSKQWLVGSFKLKPGDRLMDFSVHADPDSLNFMARLAIIFAGDEEVSTHVVKGHVIEDMLIDLDRWLTIERVKRFGSHDVASGRAKGDESQ